MREYPNPYQSQYARPEYGQQHGNYGIPESPHIRTGYLIAGGYGLEHQYVMKAKFGVMYHFGDIGEHSKYTVFEKIRAKLATNDKPNAYAIDTFHTRLQRSLRPAP